MTQQKYEEYVRSKWKHVEVHRELIAQGVNAGFKWWILIVGVGRMNSCITEAAAWQAAYDFTVAREEEIRQLKAEIEALQRNSYAGSDKFAEYIREEPNAAERIIHHCRLSRILARLQRDLAELTKDMVQPVLRD